MASSSQRIYDIMDVVSSSFSQAAIDWEEEYPDVGVTPIVESVVFDEKVIQSFYRNYLTLTYVDLFFAVVYRETGIIRKRIEVYFSGGFIFSDWAVVTIQDQLTIHSPPKEKELEMIDEIIRTFYYRIMAI